MKKTFQAITSVATAFIVMSVLSITAIFVEGTMIRSLFEYIFTHEYLFTHVWPFILLMVVLSPIVAYSTLIICETYLKLIKKSKIAWINTTFY